MNKRFWLLLWLRLLARLELSNAKRRLGAIQAGVTRKRNKRIASVALSGDLQEFPAPRAEQAAVPVAEDSL